jgi:hypothetical protein
MIGSHAGVTSIYLISPCYHNNNFKINMKFKHQNLFSQVSHFTYQVKYNFVEVYLSV